MKKPTSIQLLILTHGQEQNQIAEGINRLKDAIESILFNNKVWIDLFSDKYYDLYEDFCFEWAEHHKAEKEWQQQDSDRKSLSLLDLVAPEDNNLYPVQRLLKLLHTRAKLLLLLWQVEMRAKLNDPQNPKLQRLRKEVFKAIALARTYLKPISANL